MRILTSDSNERGDLFGRLAADLFLAQGYDHPNINVSKSGREIDLRARHRLEPKQVIAECKAHAKPIGGDHLNKFAGLLQIESEGVDEGLQVQGYFVSLSGYTETALAQEEEPKKSRFILLTGDDVQDQLIAGKMLVSREQAIEAASRVVNQSGDLRLAGGPELLAHRLGWIWLCVYEQNHERSHFALIHADGRPLGGNLAAEVIAADADAGGILSELIYCAPASDRLADVKADADRAYREYLLTELGQITLEGLPADEDVGAKRIALEDLYVPLTVQSSDMSSALSVPPREFEIQNAEFEELKEESEAEELEDSEREPIGKALERHQRIAVLAAPGAGKSTLIKRLAVAYAAREHRQRIDDQLPDADWFPIFLRCRALGTNARKPIHELISEIPVRGEFPHLGDGFAGLTSEALLAGNALLLVDGLDEVADQSDRLRFVLQLRTFLATYPNVRVVLTSRPAGFRIVAGAMASICTRRHLSEFNNEDIGVLTRAWHATVVGRSDEVDREAQKLALTIVGNDRVRRLARNPLLLTTLLLVKRWVGDLPRKRTVLYEKAIEVLLMTWNVEAHDPIDRDEAIPQLAYVAHALTQKGVQSVSSVQLNKLLGDAREQMPEILGFARATKSQFIEQIESRSSLLVMTGHTVDNGQLVPNYEFRHLTFQEYLTAVALVEGYYSGHQEADRLGDQLVPHRSDSHWSEVIALALVIAGRSAGVVVREMLATANQAEGSGWGERTRDLLVGALADEVQLPPDLVKEVAKALGRGRLPRLRTISELLEGRYGPIFEEVIKDGFYDDSDVRFPEFAGAFLDLTRARVGNLALGDGEDRQRIQELLDSEDDQEFAQGAMLAMRAIYVSRYQPDSRSEGLADAKVWACRLIEKCEEGRPYVYYAAVWALAWLGKMGAIDGPDREVGLKALLKIWRDSASPKLQRQAAWAFSAMPLIPREAKPLGEPSPDLCAFVEEQFDTEPERGKREDQRPAALLLAYYLESPWTDPQIQDRVKSLRRRSTINLRTIGDLFPAAG